MTGGPAIRELPCKRAPFMRFGRMEFAFRLPSNVARHRARVAATALALAAVAAPDAVAQGCAMCGTAVGSSDDPLAKGLFFSILLMLAVPNLLIASVGGWLFYVYRRAARQQGAPASQGGLPGPVRRPGRAEDLPEPARTISQRDHGCLPGDHEYLPGALLDSPPAANAPVRAVDDPKPTLGEPT